MPQVTPTSKQYIVDEIRKIDPARADALTPAMLKRTTLADLNQALEAAKNEASAKIKRYLVAVDPGDVHVGVAIFMWTALEGWRCIHVQEMAPGEFLAFMEFVYREEADTFAFLVVEEFRLYPWESDTQAWSEFLTCQLIGAIKYQHAVVGGEVGYWGDRQRNHPVELVFQGADIKKPTFKQLAARKIPAMWKQMGVSGQHVKDAEAHGWHYILKVKP